MGRSGGLGDWGPQHRVGMGRWLACARVAALLRGRTADNEMAETFDQPRRFLPYTRKSAVDVCGIEDVLDCWTSPPRQVRQSCSADELFWRVACPV